MKTTSMSCKTVLYTTLIACVVLCQEEASLLKTLQYNLCFLPACLPATLNNWQIEYLLLFSEFMFCMVDDVIGFSICFRRHY